MGEGMGDMVLQERITPVSIHFLPWTVSRGLNDENVKRLFWER